MTPLQKQRIRGLETEATLLRASAATLRKRRPVDAARKDSEAAFIEGKIAALKSGAA